MATTILEALQNAEYNIEKANITGLPILPLVKAQLHNAITLLEKGYGIYEEIDPILDQYGIVENVPDL
jgi:hypothetical protein